MNTYPTALRVAPRMQKNTKGSHGTQEDWVDPFLQSTSRGGTTHGRRLATGKKRMLKVAHHTLTGAEKATLETFYDANRSVPFTFNGIPNFSFTCIFVGSAITWEALDYDQWNVLVEMMEV